MYIYILDRCLNHSNQLEDRNELLYKAIPLHGPYHKMVLSEELQSPSSLA